MYTDSKSAVALSLDHVIFKNTKHILRAAEFLRDNVSKLVVALEHLPGRVMIADLLTKALARVPFQRLLAMINELYVQEQAALAD